MRKLLIQLVSVCCLSGTAAHTADKYALLVGVSKYGHSRMNDTQLLYPEADASAMADVLKKSGYIVKTLLGKEATQQAVNDALKVLQAKGDADGVVVLGLFGHGVQYNDLAFYCPYDTRMRDVTDADGKSMRDSNGSLLLEPDPETLVSMRTMLDNLGRSGAGNKVLLADCCREDPNRARGLRARAFGSTLRSDQLPRNCAVLFACSKGEQAFEHKDWGHGAFTHALLKHCHMADSNLTVNALSADVYKDVRTNVRAKTNGTASQTVNPIINGVVELKLISPAASVEKLLGMKFVAIPGGQHKTSFYDDDEEKFVAGRVRIPDTHVASARVTVGQFAQFVKDTGHRTVGELASAGNFTELRRLGFKPINGQPDPLESTGEVAIRKLIANWREGKDFDAVSGLTDLDMNAFMNWVQKETGVKVRLPARHQLEWILATARRSLAESKGFELDAGLCIFSLEGGGEVECWASPTQPLNMDEPVFRFGDQSKDPVRRPVGFRLIIGSDSE